MLLLPDGVARQAQSQFGLVTIEQLGAYLPRWQWRRLVDAGVLVRVQRGVYCTAGTPGSWRQRGLAACLAVGDPVALSHRAAARAWGVADLACPAVEVTVPPPRRPRPDTFTVHRSPLPADDLARRWGIPVTTPARTVMDLSMVLGRPLLQRVFDSMLRDRRLTLEGLRRRVERGDCRSRRSLIALEGVMFLRAHGVGESPPEEWVGDTLVAAGLPEPTRQFQVEIGRRIRMVDHAYPQWRIGIDYDGWAVHNDVTHFHGDRDRLVDFQLADWLLLQVTAAWTAPTLVDRVTAAIALRQRQTAVSQHP